MLYREITKCRSCGSDSLDEMLSLGNLCISDFILPGLPEDSAPLTLLQCADCSLVQLQHTVSRDRLYRDYYYRSGLNESMVAALRDVVNDACNHVDLVPGDIVGDIGANDGTLLSNYHQKVLRVGIEPAWNMLPDLRAHCEIAIGQFFPCRVPGGKAKIITSLACFYDLDDPNAFVAGIKDWLHPNGLWVLQMPDLRQMLDNNGFDNICHEHLTYWPIHALLQLLDRHGLRMASISKNNVNGGSTRYIIKHGNAMGMPAKAKWFWQHHMRVFAENIGRLKWETVGLLNRLVGSGKFVLGYGASTKGNTLLQYYGITPDLLPSIADRNPEKWGRQMVGTHISIISEEAMREMKPDYLFVLPWGFIDAFQQRESELLARGTQFIVPLPKLSILPKLSVIAAEHVAQRI